MCSISANAEHVFVAVRSTIVAARHLTHTHCYSSWRCWQRIASMQVNIIFL